MELDWIRSAECPKSLLLLDPQADELVTIFVQSEAVGGGLGDASTWPGVFYDSVKILRDQKARDENAQTKAIHKI